MKIIEVQSISKKFPPSTKALDNVNLSIHKSEIHCLLGENGAGKTTLMNILFGIFQPDEGRILIDGKVVTIDSPKAAIKHGLGMVHQNFQFIEKHSVLENIALGMSSASFLFPLRSIRKKIEELSDRNDLHVNIDAKIWQLSAGEKQRVEIVKALSRNARVLILDEPTSILTPQEIKGLFQVFKKMTSESYTIIFITHKLDEVMSVGDRVSVLRKGKLVKTVEVSKTTKKELAKMMVGYELLFHLNKSIIDPGKVVLETKDLCALDDRGLLALKNVSFHVRQNEILGIAGIAGNGQKELIEVLTGSRKATKGNVIILGKEATNHSARKIADAGVAHIPEDRMRIGIVSDMSVCDNLILRDYRKPPFSTRFFLEQNYINKHASNLIDKYNIFTPSIDTPAKLLSGGNIQRLILARELYGKPRLIIASHPTYGLDVAATEQIRQLLLKQRGEGAAILLISENLEEIFSISDRVAVLFEGSIMKTFQTEKANLEEIGMLMAGTTPKKELIVEAKN